MNWVLFFQFINHTLPIVITLLIFIGAIALMIGIPYCRYIYFLTIPNTEEGDESLAKYLAKKVGGRGINVDNDWQSFIPAAKTLRNSHISRKNNQ